MAAFTEADWLPSFEELTVPEIQMSAAPLRAGAHHFGRYCDQQCKEFMLCDKEEKDPRKCLREGREVTRCGVEFFNKVRQSCAEEFTTYWKCLDQSSQDLHFNWQQSSFDRCMLSELGQERPGLGFFSKVRVHTTERPKPRYGDKVPMPEPTPGPPDTTDLPEPESAKLGSRIFFFN